MIFKMLLLALGLTIITLILKDHVRPIALMLSAAGCLLILISALGIVNHFSGFLEEFKRSNEAISESIGIIAKTLGVAYLTNFGSDICSDAGEKAIATALETAGKLIMLSMALPMLSGIFNSVVNMIGGSL